MVTKIQKTAARKAIKLQPSTVATRFVTELLDHHDLLESQIAAIRDVVGGDNDTNIVDLVKQRCTNSA